MAENTDSPGAKCPKCQQSPCACELPEGTGSKGLNAKVASIAQIQADKADA